MDDFKPAVAPDMLNMCMEAGGEQKAAAGIRGS